MIIDWYEIFNTIFLTHHTWIFSVNWFTTALMANKMSEHLLSAYYMPGISLSSLDVLPHLILTQSYLGETIISFLKMRKDFPGGPVGKTLCSQSRGPRFHPWSGKQIPHATTKSSHATTKDPACLSEDPECCN